MKKLLLAFGVYLFFVASMMVVGTLQSPVPVDYFQWFNPFTYVMIFFIDFLFIMMPLVIPGALLVVFIEQLFYRLIRGHELKRYRFVHNIVGLVVLLFISVYSYTQAFSVGTDFILNFVWLKQISLATVFFLLTRYLGNFVIGDTRLK